MCSTVLLDSNNFTILFHFNKLELWLRKQNKLKK